MNFYSRLGFWGSRSLMGGCKGGRNSIHSSCGRGYKRPWRQISTRTLKGKEPIVLGIETSCDDTAVAIVGGDGKVYCEKVSSQFEVHEEWGGVVPSLAARQHEKNLPLLLDRCMKESGLAGGFSSLSAVAVTSGPGMALCLKIGLTTAKDLARQHDLPFIGINHLEAHALVARLLNHGGVEFPFLTLLVSGGHCMLVLAEDIGDYKLLGQTLDDSVGEAYDKAARMLNLYTRSESEGAVSRHGGALLEHCARGGDPFRYAFTEPMKRRPDCDFSFSGLKAALLRASRKVDLDNPQVRADLAASFQRAAIDHLVSRTRRALAWCNRSRSIHELPLVVCGGVAANSYLREKLRDITGTTGTELIFPEPRYCTDNAVMVAWTGIERLRKGATDNIDEVDLRPRWPIGERVDLSVV